MPKVVITEGPDTGKEYEVTQAAILGRLDTNDIPVRDGKASREHAKIYKQGQEFAIVDLNSSNGTFVNGQRITKRVLEPGDVVEIGLVRLRFEDPEAEERKAKKPERNTLDDAFAAAGVKPAAATAAGGAEQISMRGHQPIQYSRIKPGKPLLGFDLDQFSGGGRFVIWVVLALFFAALFYGAYLLVAG